MWRNESCCSRKMFLRKTSLNGNQMGDLVSLLQKSIRRCDSEKAMEAAIEIDKSGFGNSAWNRLKIIASEDIGIANSDIACLVVSNYKIWQEFVGRKTSKSFENEKCRQLLVETIWKMSNSPKSRIVSTWGGASLLKCFESKEKLELDPSKLLLEMDQILVQIFSLFGEKQKDSDIESILKAKSKEEQDQFLESSKEKFFILESTFGKLLEQFMFSFVGPDQKENIANIAKLSPKLLALLQKHIDTKDKVKSGIFNSLCALIHEQIKNKDQYQRLHILHICLFVIRQYCLPETKSTILDSDCPKKETEKLYSRNEMISVPEWALDKHTAKGKQKKRGLEHFFNESSQVQNENVINIYHNDAKIIYETMEKELKNQKIKSVIIREFIKKRQLSTSTPKQDLEIVALETVPYVESKESKQEMNIVTPETKDLKIVVLHHAKRLKSGI